VSLADVAQLLKVSKVTAGRMKARGELPPEIRLGRLPRWSVAEVEEWIAFGCPNRDRWQAIRAAGAAPPRI
jgi:predicted DNA-binding transcriptional regulator AlpA